jgi:hypothetical protein
MTYLFNGKTYMGGSGLRAALSKANGGAQVSLIANNQITCYSQDGKTVICSYVVKPGLMGQLDEVVAKPSQPITPRTQHE